MGRQNSRTAKGAKPAKRHFCAWIAFVICVLGGIFVGTMIGSFIGWGIGSGDAYLYGHSLERGHILAQVNREARARRREALA